MRSLLVSAAIAVSMAGCATQQVPLSAAEPVPASRIYAADLVSATPNATFVRDSGFAGTLCTYDLYVGSTKVFSIRPGEKIGLKLPLGSHIMRVESPPTSCLTGVQYLTGVFTAGDSQVFRMYIDDNMVRQFSRVE